MSNNLIIPGQQPRPQPGIQFNVSQDGPQVILQVLATAVLTHEQAAEMANLIASAAVQAKSFIMSVEGNGVKLTCPTPV